MKQFPSEHLIFFPKMLPDLLSVYVLFLFQLSSIFSLLILNYWCIFSVAFAWDTIVQLRWKLFHPLNHHLSLRTVWLVSSQCFFPWINAIFSFQVVIQVSFEGYSFICVLHLNCNAFQIVTAHYMEGFLILETLSMSSSISGKRNR